MEEAKKDPMAPEILYQTDVCPTCGGKGVYRQTAEAEAAAGRFNLEDIQGIGIPEQGIVLDPRKTVLMAPGIMSIRDICLTCGQYFPVLVTRQKIDINQMRNAMTPGPRPGGPGGIIRGRG